MSSETTMVAKQCRLQEWAAQIRDCQSRPAGTSVVSWCACHGITEANYYYRLRRVRKACLENIPEEIPSRQIVPVDPGLLQAAEGNDSFPQSGLDLSIKGISIHVTESTSMSLLAEVLKVAQHA